MQHVQTPVGSSVITSSLRNSHFGLDVQERFAKAVGRKWVIADLKGYRGMKVHGCHMYGVGLPSMNTAP